MLKLKSIFEDTDKAGPNEDLYPAPPGDLASRVPVGTSPKETTASNIGLYAAIIAGGVRGLGRGGQ
jgi:hypothetical protein